MRRVFVFFVLAFAPAVLLAQATHSATLPKQPNPAPTSVPETNPAAVPAPTPGPKTDANGILSPQQIQKLFQTVADKDLENDKKQRDYTYIERDEEHKLDGNGHVKSAEAKTYEVLMLYGEQVRRLIARDDKPLSQKDAAKEEEKIQKLMLKREKESDGDRHKRLAKEEKEREQGRQFVREVADAYNFHLLGVEQMDGRATYVIDGDPRPGYEPHMKEAKVLPKFRFRAWIDKDESQWEKLDIECIDTVALGWILARLHKGTRVMIEQTRVNDEVWLPKHVRAKVDARVVLLKNFNLDEDVTFKDYKKFRTDTKIVGVGELKEQ